MKRADYRAALVDALARTEGEPDGATALALIGQVRGCGARGERVGLAMDGRYVTLFTRGDVQRMLAKLDAGGKPPAAQRYRPAVLPASRATGRQTPVEQTGAYREFLATREL